MSKTTAQIYAERNGSLKNIQDIEAKLEKLADRFVIESIFVAEEVKLNSKEMMLLKDGSLLSKIKERVLIKENEGEFKYSPIPARLISYQVCTQIVGNPLTLGLCWLPILVSSFLVFLINPKVLINPLVNINQILQARPLSSFPYQVEVSPLLFISIFLLLVYSLKTITNLHDYFLNHGERKRVLSYFSFSMRDLWFFVYSHIILLRTGIIVALVVLPIHLIIVWGIGENVPLLAFLPVHVALLMMLYFNARYSMALPAIIANKKNWRTTWSFQVTKDNGWKIVLLVFLIPVIIETIFNTYVFATNIFFFENLLRALYLTFEVGVLVKCFQHITKEKN